MKKRRTKIVDTKNYEDTIQIAGMVWKIKTSKAVTDSTDCWGITSLSNQTIFIDPCATVQQFNVTLIHEVLHAIWASMCMNKSNAPLTEEYVVSLLAQGLYQVLTGKGLKFVTTTERKGL